MRREAQICDILRMHANMNRLLRSVRLRDGLFLSVDTSDLTNADRSSIGSDCSYEITGHGKTSAVVHTANATGSNGFVFARRDQGGLVRAPVHRLDVVQGDGKCVCCECVDIL